MREITLQGHSYERTRKMGRLKEQLKNQWKERNEENWEKVITESQRLYYKIPVNFGAG